MAKKKRVRPPRMVMTEEEHAQWHREHEGKDLTSKEHGALMKHLGISEKEDREWHEAQDQSRPGADSGVGSSKQAAELPSDVKTVNCFAIGGGFIDYCVRPGNKKEGNR